MYERFTDRARKVMQLANQEAQRQRDKHQQEQADKDRIAHRKFHRFTIASNI